MATALGPSDTSLDGKYRILAALGQGGTANVSLAVARGPSGFNKLVVLKEMKSNLKSEPEFAEMFMNEARLAARLNHPNIVQTNEVFEHNGLPVIVMQYLEGQPLSNVIVRAQGTGEFPLQMHLRVISEALSGLHYSHELQDYDGTPLNVVHRDMTPHNVFVAFDGQTKILDFGIAKLSGSTVETQTGVIKGKLRYMPPEQITGEGVDRRTDIFAVGVMLWEAATGEKMWKGMGEATIMNRLLNGELPSPREVNPDVADELERIVMKSLATEKEDRYPSSLALQNDLDEFLKTLPQVQNREIGAVVAKLFDDVREQTKRVIEAQLSRVASLSAAEYAQAEPIELTSMGLTQSGYTAGSTGTKTMLEPQRKSWLLYVTFSAVILLGGFVLWQSLGSGRNQPAAVVEPAVENPVPVEPADKGPKEMRLRITAFPATAELFLDDQPLSSNPFSKQVVSDGSKHTLRAQALDYVTESREIVFDQDQEIVLSLQAAPKVKDPKPSAGVRYPARRPNVREEPTGTPTPRADCSPPFYIDETGIKKFKPECL